MVGQRFISLLSEHPWFEVTVVAASSRSAGKTYDQALEGRWSMGIPIPPPVEDLVVKNAETEVREISDSVNFVFSAVDMKKNAIRELEEAYAIAECPVISNNSAHRFTPDVPMIIPEVNPQHLDIIPHQRNRLKTTKGFIAVKSNCSLQSYVPAIHPLREIYGIEKALVCTYQAISGAGKTFETWPEMKQNVIPYIPGEEEKSELEPLKIWGNITNDIITPAKSPHITSQCFRIAALDGHMAAVFMSLDKKPDSTKDIIAIWNDYETVPQRLKLPSSPSKLLHYFGDEDRPQTRLDCMIENGMAIALGRLRPDTQYDYKFVGLSHNTIRGAAGGAILTAELLCAQGYI